MMQGKEDRHRNDIVYEVFVQSFRDSNGDGIGDLPGLISKLDYIKGLGATAVWITPVHPSPSYHKYDVTDYYAIHPDYGTMEDMDRLIVELHRRDMKLIMDLVINHTSALHPWFVESSSSDNNPYHDYYVWKDYEAVQNDINKKTTTFDSDNITQWHAGEKKKEHYYGFFWKGMPDLNFDNPKVREEIYKIALFWIKKGVDGFRMDAARHIYPDDQLDDTRMFWEEFTAKMKVANPDIKIIGEVWSDPNTLATLFKGLPSLYNFELSKIIPLAINSGDAKIFTETYSGILSAYNNAGVPYEDAILLCNHDMNRIRSSLQGDIQKSKLAASILLTLPGTPYIYYGEEIGMLGTKPDEHIREPFLWGDDNFQKSSWIKPVHSTPQTVVPLSLQAEDPKSILNHYRQWIRIRKENPVLASGRLEFLEIVDEHVIGYKIYDPDNTVLVLHNLGNTKSAYLLTGKQKIVHGDCVIHDDELELAPHSTALVIL